MRELRHQGIDNGPDAVFMPDAHVHVRAPNQHLATPVLGAFDDLGISHLRADGVGAEIGKRVSPQRPQQ